MFFHNSNHRGRMGRRPETERGLLPSNPSRSHFNRYLFLRLNFGIRGSPVRPSEGPVRLITHVRKQNAADANSDASGMKQRYSNDTNSFNLENLEWES